METPQDAVLVGRAAAGGDPANTFYSVKRIIGLSLAEVAADLGGLRYQVTAGSAAVGSGDNSHGGVADASEAGLRLQCPARGASLAPEEVSAALLRHLLARAEAHLGSAVTNAVRTAFPDIHIPS